MSGRNFVLRNVLVPNQETGKGTNAVDVVVEGGVITKIVDANTAGDCAGCTEVNGEGNMLLLPGMVNGHTHSSEMWDRGSIQPFPLELWLCELIDHSAQDPEMYYLSAIHCGIETLLSGGTCIMDHLSLIPDARAECVKEALRGYQDLGVRAYVAPLLADLDIPFCIPSEPAGTLKETKLPPRDPALTEELLRVMKELIQFVHENSESSAEKKPDFYDPAKRLLVNMGVGPTGIQLASEELYKGAAELSTQYNLVRHTHLLETRAQRDLSVEKFGKTAVAQLKEWGYLSEKTSCAHSIWLTDDDIALMNETKSTAVHNALSNLRLGSGIAPVLKYLANGVNVSFGCDGAASNDGQDLLEAVKIGSMLHNITDTDYRNWLTPIRSLNMATKGGYRALGLDSTCGSIEVGQHADLVLYDLNNLSLLPRTDALGLLLWGRPTRAVHSVWVAGRRVVANGTVTTVDVEDIRKRVIAKQETYRPQPRQSELVSMLEPNYRRVMSIGKKE